MGYKIRGNKIYVTGTVNGKHYRISTGKEATPLNCRWIEKNHREVLFKLIDAKMAAENKKSAVFSEYAMYSLQLNEYARKPNTVNSYYNISTKLIIPFFANYLIDEIKPNDIKAWQSSLVNRGYAKGTIRTARAVMSTIMNDAKMDELIQTNPIGSVKLPKSALTPPKPIVPFTLEEVKQILDQSSEEMRIFLTAAFFTGMRTGELLALKWEDIDFNANRIYVRATRSRGREGTPKTGKERMIDMLPIAEAALREQYRKSGLRYHYIFNSKKGRPWANATTLSYRWKQILKKCGFAYRRIYETRHTFATMMLVGGEDVLWVSQMLGHSTIATVINSYAKYIPSAKPARAEFLQDFSHTFRTQNSTKAV
ncbi:MAG: tyrosine-type recombinase/integrase [Sulfurovum sp.]|nr:tyrosine-type recombinase/integrase [Sulfurovum sp.]